MMPLLLTCSLVIMGLILFLSCDDKLHGYKVIYNHGPKHSKSDYTENVADGVKFIKTLLSSYEKVVDREVHSKFKAEFQLFKQNSVGAKLVISSFGESLIYIFPNAQNHVVVDCIDFPVQAALAYGFIDLNNPPERVNLSKVGLKIPLPGAINKYKSEPGRITITEGDGGAVFSSGKLVFENVHKIFSFKRRTILGLMNGIAFRNTSPHYVQIYGHAGYHDFNLQGLLMISSENTFHWSFEIARKLGMEMAEIEIKDLLTKSEFFKLSLADKKLKPKAENIVQKKARSEKDKSYQYPLWEFKKDVFELKEEAKQFSIDSSYVDELLKEPSLKTADGTLFVYYSNARDFMLQWSLMNLFFLVILIVLTLSKYGDTALLVLAIRAFSVVGTNLSIISLVTIANGWVFSKKPESFTVPYWILPCILYLLCIAYSVVIMNLQPSVESRG